MYRLKTQASFDSAHFLKGYDGKCSNLHGHRWTVEVEAGSDKLRSDEQSRGMVVDFSSLKKDLKGLTDSLDHCLIMEKGSLMKSTEKALVAEGFRIVRVDFRPTAENLAKYVYCRMKALGYQVTRVWVYETPNNVAMYEE